MADDVCPKCGSNLAEISETPTGRRLRRCLAGAWNPNTKKVEGCDYVLWLPVEPEQLNENCPLCKAPLVLQVTRFGKRMKKCSKGGWDKEKKEATGCSFVEWINTVKESLDELCPDCQAPLVLMTTAAGKRMKKCSTGGWDKETRTPTGCTYVEWLK